MQEAKGMEKYNKLKTPPEWALKPIKGGRLKGKTDISPQWRIQAMTEVYGICGIGWSYKINRVWREDGADGQVFAFAEVEISIVSGGYLSIPGIGGSMLISKESGGLHCNDEAYKMAVTDALSVALKFLGVGADVYAGQCETKYDNAKDGSNTRTLEATVPDGSEVGVLCVIHSVDPRKTKTGKTYYVIDFIEEATGIQSVCSTWNESEAKAANDAKDVKLKLSYKQNGNYKNFVKMEDA